MPINTWRQTCRFCDKKVGERKGWAEKSSTTGRWLVWHKTCGAAPEPSPAEVASRKRLPYADN